MIRSQNRRMIVSRQIERFLFDESAATAIEYAMIAAGVGVVIAGTVMNLGSAIKTTLYDKIASAFQ